VRAIVATILIVLTAGCATTGGPRVDTDYVLALSTANKFMEAWRSRDQDAGLALLSDELRASRPELDWRNAISGPSNPHHQSYEIADGVRLPDGRLRFSVWLYHHYTGLRHLLVPRGKPEWIVLIKTGQEEWKVDGMPQL
jgi:hypothetical protein